MGNCPHMSIWKNRYEQAQLPDSGEIMCRYTRALIGFNSCAARHKHANKESCCTLAGCKFPNKMQY